MIEKKIDRNYSGMRLDRYLRKSFPQEPLSVFFAILRKKKVRVNGVIGKANTLLNDGDVVQIYENLKSYSASPTASLPQITNSWNSKKDSWKVQKLDIIFNNEEYLVVNKTSGLPSQPGSGTQIGESLVEYLWAYGHEERLDFKPTIVHRLDKETSGLIIAALHGDTLRELTAKIRNHEIKKFYFALVKGNIHKERGTIKGSLLRTDNAKGSKMQIDSSGKDSITHYAVKAHYEGYDLVKINLETGRMHQIRAHFASIGHPLLGDTRYGDFSFNREAKKSYGLNRLFLHAARLEFNWKGKNVVHEAPLPKELKSVLEKLKKL